MEERFKIEILDIDKFVEVNQCKQITNPVMFNRNTGPTPDGLLSTDIFGITQEERSGIFAYIALKEYFIHPYYYKIWLKLDKNLRACVYETDTFKLDENGYLVQDDNGETGLGFLYKNRKKLGFKKTKKTILLKALLDGRTKDKLFINKYLVIPPFYRDVNTAKGGKIGVGEINKLYIALLNTVRALDETALFGLTFTGGTRGRIQDILLQIYNWLTIGKSDVGGEHTGAGIFKKFGIMRRSVMAKTTDNSARLVISAPKIDVNSREDLMVDMDYSSIPLSAALVVAYPFVIYNLNRFFSNEFGGKSKYPMVHNGELIYVDLNNPLLEFSNDRFDEEINEFVHGYSNRFKPVKIPNTNGLDLNMKFKGYRITPKEYANGVRETGNIIERDMCWMDVLYMAACEAVKDKVAIITRYPMDSYFNQLYTHIHVASLIDTEPVVINGELYKWYPKFDQKDIGTDTSNKFIDTLSMANPYCDLMGADYDGDQVTLKMAYSVESNEELNKYIDSKAQFITVSGDNGRVASKEAIQAMYNLTLVLPEDFDKLTQNIEFV